MTHWMALGPGLSTVKSLCYLTSRNSIMVITFRCGRNNPGSIPGYGMFFLHWQYACQLIRDQRKPPKRV